MGTCNSGEQAPSSYTSNYTRKTFKMAEHDSKNPSVSKMPKYHMNPKFIWRPDKSGMIDATQHKSTEMGKEKRYNLHESILQPDPVVMVVRQEEVEQEHPERGDINLKRKTEEGEKIGGRESKHSKYGQTQNEEEVEVIIDVLTLEENESFSKGKNRKEKKTKKEKDLCTTTGIGIQNTLASKKSVLKSITNPDTNKPVSMRKLQTKVMNVELQYDDLADLSGSHSGSFKDDEGVEESIHCSKKSLHKIVTMY